MLMLSGQGLLQNKHYSNGYYVLKWFLLFFLKLHVHKLILTIVSSLESLCTVECL